ncbi:MAG TPA: ATP-binding cassette domain-containing protein, partial [Conexibacter sp.]|nr:ATP-binding cassette domain-containing protein [Conexibacter sp.]
VQMIFQDPYQKLNPRMKVGAIVAEPLRIRGIPKREHAERVARALADVSLGEQLLDRHPHQLSGGQRQRVAIAAALVLEPEGLICDEPVSMLDVSVRTQILEVLLELRRRRSLTLLFVTHDLSLAWAICDRLAVMYLGRVVEQGPAAQVIEQPQHPYTRALVDAVPVPRPGGGGAARAALRRAARRGADPRRLPLPSALPAPLRAVRPDRSAAAGGRPRRAARRLPAARLRRPPARRP